jgi:type I restriction enzyme M protein
MKTLRAGGKAGIVIKNTFLSNMDNASVSLRRELLENFDLHTILDCPSGTFQGAGVKTVVLFFTKGTPTSTVWYYQLNPKRSLGKTSPLNDNDLIEFVTLQTDKSDSSLSWSLDVNSIDQATFDLSVKNPNTVYEEIHKTPDELLTRIEDLNTQSSDIILKLRSSL